MLRPKIVLFSQDLSRCRCYHGIFCAEFEVHSIDAEEALAKKAKNGDADAVVICFCSATESEANHWLPLVSHANHLPVFDLYENARSRFYPIGCATWRRSFSLVQYGNGENSSHPF
jgi:hypothetical protein